MHELDLRADLPVTNFKLFDNRFGIKAVIAPLQGMTGRGKISFTHDGHPVTVKLRSCKGDEIELPGLAWAPRLIPPDHPEFGIRVKAGHIDMVIGPGNINGHFSTRSNINYNLREERSFIDQVGLLALDYWSSLGPVSISVEVDQGQIFKATIKLEGPLETWAMQSWVCAQYFLDILGGDRCKKINISLLDFHRFMQDYFGLAAVQNSNSFRFEGLFESEVAEFSKVVGYSYGQFGDWTFGAIHEFKVVSRSQEDEKLAVVLGKPKIIHKLVYKRPLAQTIEHIAREFNEFLARQHAPVATPENGDLLKWGRSCKVVIEVHDPIRPT